uniref:Uncharacterized protein n=1 Tax=Rhizophora mucronata TaxID=61149 RepID=A0A2P2PQ73_RHIMU
MGRASLGVTVGLVHYDLEVTNSS